MGSRRASPFRFLNRVVNPVMALLLRSPAGAILGKRLLVVDYTGRRTAMPRRLVAQYRQEGHDVVITVGAPQAKNWWRNFREPADVDVVVRRKRLHGQARLNEFVDSDGSRRVTVRIDLDDKLPG